MGKRETVAGREVRERHYVSGRPAVVGKGACKEIGPGVADSGSRHLEVHLGSYGSGLDPAEFEQKTVDGAVNRQVDRRRESAERVQLGERALEIHVFAVVLQGEIGSRAGRGHVQVAFADLYQSRERQRSPLHVDEHVAFAAEYLIVEVLPECRIGIERLLGRPRDDDRVGRIGSREVIDSHSREDPLDVDRVVFGTARLNESRRNHFADEIGAVCQTVQRIPAGDGIGQHLGHQLVRVGIRGQIQRPIPVQIAIELNRDATDGRLPFIGDTVTVEVFVFDSADAGRIGEVIAARFGVLGKDGLDSKVHVLFARFVDDEFQAGDFLKRETARGNEIRKSQKAVGIADLRDENRVFGRAAGTGSHRLDTDAVVDVVKVDSQSCVRSPLRQVDGLEELAVDKLGGRADDVVVDAVVLQYDLRTRRVA